MIEVRRFFMTNHSRAQMLGAFTFLFSILLLPILYSGSGGDAGYWALFSTAFSCFAGFSLLVFTGGSKAPKWPYGVAALCFLNGIVQGGIALFGLDLGNASLGFFTETTLILTHLFGCWLNVLFLLIVGCAFVSNSEKKGLTPLLTRLTIRGFGLVALFISTQLYSVTSLSWDESGWAYIIFALGLALTTFLLSLGLISAKKPEQICFLMGPILAASVVCHFVGNPFVDMIMAFAKHGQTFPIYSAIAALCVGALGMPWLLGAMGVSESKEQESATSSLRTRRR
jgi:hypothetical protein